MYHKLEQREKLTAIVVLNVAAYIPKDFSTADLQKKKSLQTTNVFVIEEISCKTQPLQDFHAKISFEHLHKSSLYIGFKYVNTRNIQYR